MSFKKSLSVYIGKFRNEFGYAEFYKGKTKTNLHAKVLAMKQCKPGDRVILKDGTRVVKTGRIQLTGGYNLFSGKRAKTVIWDK